MIVEKTHLFQKKTKKKRHLLLDHYKNKKQY